MDKYILTVEGNLDQLVYIRKYLMSEHPNLNHGMWREGLVPPEWAKEASRRGAVRALHNAADQINAWKFMGEVADWLNTRADRIENSGK